MARLSCGLSCYPRLRAAPKPTPYALSRRPQAFDSHEFIYELKIDGFRGLGPRGHRVQAQRLAVQGNRKTFPLLDQGQESTLHATGSPLPCLSDQIGTMDRLRLLESSTEFGLLQPSEKLPRHQKTLMRDQRFPELACPDCGRRGEADGQLSDLKLRFLDLFRQLNTADRNCPDPAWFWRTTAFRVQRSSPVAASRANTARRVPPVE